MFTFKTMTTFKIELSIIIDENGYFPNKLEYGCSLFCASNIKHFVFFFIFNLLDRAPSGTQ